MTAEFTGERVIPGQVDVDLWNEHVARYAFVSRLAGDRRVLDAGCGAGYGAAKLAFAGAASVTALDIAADAVALAHAAASALLCVQASAANLPFAAESFDLVVAFEVIEHLTDWSGLLTEAARVLSPAGIFVVSTPNIHFYAETRRETGPNPYHEHEFAFEEFQDALRAVFPSTAMYLQNHTEGVGFHPVRPASATDLRIEAWSGDPASCDSAPGDPASASFFIGICSASAIPEVPGLVYIPNAANAVREKLLHIARLEGEIRTKDAWLADQQRVHTALLELHHAQSGELQSRHDWARSLEATLTDAGARIVSLQDELAAQQQRAREIIATYEAALHEANATLEERTRRGQQVEAEFTAQLVARTAELDAQTAELGRCVEFLHKTEADLHDRTRWALDLNAQRERLEAQLAAVRTSRWVKLGRAVGVGPELANL